MASSIIGGLLLEGVDPQQLRVSDPSAEQRAKSKDLGIVTYSENNESLENANLVILCVKPQIAKEVTSRLLLKKDQLFVSIVAGINTNSLQSWLTERQPIIRCMPNTPALIREGITALYANKSVTEEQKTSAQNLVTAIGKILWVEDERKLDVVTALSGSGPAYFFYLMEQMIEAGKELGMDEQEAIDLTIQTATGAAKMASQDSQATPKTLRINVTSAGGTTESALNTFKNKNMNHSIKLAIKNAHARSQELSREFGEQP